MAEFLIELVKRIFGAICGIILRTIGVKYINPNNEPLLSGIGLGREVVEKRNTVN